MFSLLVIKIIKSQYHIIPYSDRALLIQFEQRIDPAIHAKVTALTQSLQNAGVLGVVSIISAYCSVTVCYDPDIISYKRLRSNIEDLINMYEGKSTQRFPRTIEIPVNYGKEHALDMHEVQRQTGLSWHEIVYIHTSTVFRVYMLGFIPGFAYMGTLPDNLYTHRRATPRLRVPRNAVAIAGNQTGIYPSAAPGGWQVIGRAMVDVFTPSAEQPFLFSVGDEVRFISMGGDPG